MTLPSVFFKIGVPNNRNGDIYKPSTGKKQSEKMSEKRIRGGGKKKIKSPPETRGQLLSQDGSNRIPFSIRFGLIGGRDPWGGTEGVRTQTGQIWEGTFPPCENKSRSIQRIAGGLEKPKCPSGQTG